MIASLPRGFRVGILSLGLVLLGASVLPAHAQDLQDLVVPSVTNTYAIENARVVQTPGQVLDSATVVVQDGLIEAVGSDVEIPYDARRIKGDSLVVYAGFIDGLSHAGVEMPEQKGNGEENGENDVDPGDPPPDRAGIQPDRSVRPLLTPDDSKLKSLRKIGFTAGHVVPKGQMLPGSGAYVFYGGKTVDEMVLESNPSLFAQIKPADDYVYPSTEMGVIAKFRQLYREAARRQKLQTAYAKNPEGPRPPRDPIHSAFFPVLNDQKPLFFYADGALTIHRVLALKNELGFPLKLAGLGESFRTVDDLQNVDAPLFLTLSLPDKPKRSPAQDTTVADTTDQPAKYYNPDLRTQSYRDVPEEEKNLELRHAMARQKYLETAATLHGAGLSFGFTTRKVDAGKVRKNLRTIIENGLPKQAALAALTTRPASLLGLDDQLGTVEEGKIANLVVTDGPYFNKDTKVQHVFVDGQLYDYSSDEEDGGEVTGDVSAVLGTWSYTIETSQGEFSGTFTIEGDQSRLDGTFTGPQGEEQEMQSISFDGTTLSFSVESPEGNTVSISVTVKEGTFEGTASTSDGSFTITGKRTSAPNNVRK